MDDFCGFTYKGVHSSELGLVRVSDGSRYFHNLTANFRDKTMEIPGGDGVYFFESLYNSNSFNINVAFDSVTEMQMRLIRQVFNGKDTGELIFDEAPYKAYIVKVQAPPQIKYVCFMEGGQRIYKGEMAISFISYYPYAICTKKWLDQYSSAEYPNKDEWAASSGLIDNTSNTYDYQDAPMIYLYNPGDLETDIKIFINANAIALQYGISVRLKGTLSAGLGEITIGQLDLSPIPLEVIESNNDLDNYICINSKTNLIEGRLSADIDTQSGSLYNQYISSGDFFKIPIYTNETNKLKLSITTLNSGPSTVIHDVKYNYLYY